MAKIEYPTHYEGLGMRVFTNPCGEVFVENIDSGISIRIRPFLPNGLQFTTDERVSPTQADGSGSWHITPRPKMVGPICGYCGEAPATVRRYKDNLLLCDDCFCWKGGTAAVLDQPNG